MKRKLRRLDEDENIVEDGTLMDKTDDLVVFLHAPVLTPLMEDDKKYVGNADGFCSEPTCPFKKM